MQVLAEPVKKEEEECNEIERKIKKEKKVSLIYQNCVGNTSMY